MRSVLLPVMYRRHQRRTTRLRARRDRLHPCQARGPHDDDEHGDLRPRRRGLDELHVTHVTHKLSLVMFVEDTEVDGVVACMIEGAHTGNVGDGLVTVTDLAAVYNIRNGVPAPA